MGVRVNSSDTVDMCPGVDQLNKWTKNGGSQVCHCGRGSLQIGKGRRLE